MGPVAVGIDPSSARIVACIGWGSVDVEFMICDCRPGPEHRPRALADIYKFGRSLGAILPIPPRALRIGLESPTLARGGPGSVIPQAMASGALQAGLAAFIPAPVDIIMVPTWKKNIVGNGSASKDAIREFVETNYPHIAKTMITDKGKFDQDMCDAFCIYLYTYEIERVAQRARRIADKRKLAAS